MIWTGNFRTAGNLPNAVAISHGVPRGWRGLRYLPLAPTWAMLKVNERDYDRHFGQILAGLNPVQVVSDLERLTDGQGAVLLCWEAFNVRCHRRWVAEWLETSLGLVIPEYQHDRTESLPFTDQPSKQA